MVSHTAASLVAMRVIACEGLVCVGREIDVRRFPETNLTEDSRLALVPGPHHHDKAREARAPPNLL